MRINLEDKKYTYVREDDGAVQYALRYGKPWRDLTGDNFVAAMADEIDDLRNILAQVSAASANLPEALRSRIAEKLSE